MSVPIHRRFYRPRIPLAKLTGQQAFLFTGCFLTLLVKPWQFMREDTGGFISITTDAGCMLRACLTLWVHRDANEHICNITLMFPKGLNINWVINASLILSQTWSHQLSLPKQLKRLLVGKSTMGEGNLPSNYISSSCSNFCYYKPVTMISSKIVYRAQLQYVLWTDDKLWQFS